MDPREYEIQELNKIQAHELAEEELRYKEYPQVCVCVCVWVWVWVWVWVCVCGCVWVCVHAQPRAPNKKYPQVCLFVFVCLCVYYIIICMNCVHAYIHIFL